MSIIMPNLEDAFDVGHNEGKKEAYNKILTLINDGCDLAFIKSYVNMESAFLGKPTIKGVLRHGNDRSVRADAPAGRDNGRKEN